MDARYLKRRMLCRIVSLFVLLSLSASWSAHAVLDQVAPETVPVYTSRLCSLNYPSSSCLANTLRAACDLYYQVSRGPGYILSDPAPVFTNIVGGNAWLPYTYSCMYNYYFHQGDSTTYHPDSQLAVVDVTPPLCRAATPAYKFNAVSGMCERDVPEQCPQPNVIDPKTGKCGPKCTVDPIPALPEPKDDKDYACTQSLDKGAGNDIDGVCPALNDKLTGKNGQTNQMECLAKKLKSLSPPIPYNGPSSTIRTEEYQKHLLKIWEKSEDIKNKTLTAIQKQVCASVIADINAQMKHHGIAFEPSDEEEAAPHVQGIAFDIPKSVATALVERATMTRIKPIIQANYPGCIVCMHIPLVTGDVQDYISSSVVHPPACNLKWGGSFGDKVHFQLRQP